MRQKINKNTILFVIDSNKLFQTSMVCVDASITDWPSSFFIVDGLGVRRDYKMAIKFFNLASQTGKDITAVRSQFRLRV